MSNIDKQALRNAATAAISAITRLNYEADSGPADAEAVRAYHALAYPEAVLTLLDELESKERQNGYLREQRDEWERKAISNFEDCSEMAARIEELESQRQMAFMAGNRWADKFREAEKRIVEMEVLRYPMIVIDIDGGIPSAVCVPDAQHSERFDWNYEDWANHLGGRHQNNDPANYYEFGSFMAVAEMLRQFGNVQRKAGWNACRDAMLQFYTEPRQAVRSEHAEWSQSTFGNVGPVGPLKHLSKEALEAANKPDDLSEWADMQFLMWDAQRRAGITDEEITQAMIDKLAVNKARSWPEPKDGEPRLHIKRGQE